MRTFILILIAILVFAGCAVVGYNIARNLNPGVEVVEATPAFPDQVSEQHNVMVMRVDDLNAKEPRLISVWFVSLFIVNNNPNSLTLAQIYPPRASSPRSMVLERNFILDEEKNPYPPFWDAVKQYNFEWEGFILFDTRGANLFLQWLVGPTDFQAALDEAARSPENSLRMAEQTCQSITDSSGRSLAQFEWSSVVPNHFHSNLNLETGLKYWDRMTDPSSTVHCEFLPTP